MKQLIIQSYEHVRYDYTLDLSEQYVNETNEWLRDYYKQANGEIVPFLDAEMLIDIWNNAGDLDLINVDRKERGQEPIENVKIIDLRYPSENADDLFDYVYNILLDDVWSCDEEQIDGEVDHYVRVVKENGVEVKLDSKVYH